MLRYEDSPKIHYVWRLRYKNIYVHRSHHCKSVKKALTASSGKSGFVQTFLKARSVKYIFEDLYIICKNHLNMYTKCTKYYIFLKLNGYKTNIKRALCLIYVN